MPHFDKAVFREAIGPLNVPAATSASREIYFPYYRLALYRRAFQNSASLRLLSCDPAHALCEDRIALYLGLHCVLDLVFWKEKESSALCTVKTFSLISFFSFLVFFLVGFFPWIVICFYLGIVVHLNLRLPQINRIFARSQILGLCFGVGYISTNRPLFILLFWIRIKLAKLAVVFDESHRPI